MAAVLVGMLCWGIVGPWVLGTIVYFGLSRQVRHHSFTWIGHYRTSNAPS